MPRTKYLVETSAVVAVLGHSTADHNAYVAKELGDGTVETSVYVRKEFIRRFICDLIELAANVDFYTQPHDALLNLADEYGRKSKTGLNLIGWILERDGQIADSHELAVRICDLALDFGRRVRSRPQMQNC